MSEKIIGEYITARLLGSGNAAVHMVRIENSELGIYEDVQQTGIGRYKTIREAKLEAKQWAESEGIDYKE